jgi:hypothetical protein
MTTACNLRGASAHLCVKRARRHMEARDLVVKGLVAAVDGQRLDDSVHDLHAGGPADVPQPRPGRGHLLHSAPPVVHFWPLQESHHAFQTLWSFNCLSVLSCFDSFSQSADLSFLAPKICWIARWCCGD